MQSCLSWWRTSCSTPDNSWKWQTFERAHQKSVRRKSSSMWFVVNSKRKNTKWWLTVRADHSACRDTRLHRVGPLLSKFLLVASNLTQRLKWAFLGVVVSKNTTVLILAYFSSINEVRLSFTLARKLSPSVSCAGNPSPRPTKSTVKYLTLPSQDSN